MKLISWTGWTKEDWKMFLDNVSDLSVWICFIFFVLIFLAIG